MKLEDKHYTKQEKPYREGKHCMISLLCGILKSQIHRSNLLLCTTIEENSSDCLIISKNHKKANFIFIQFTVAEKYMIPKK